MAVSAGAIVQCLCGALVAAVAPLELASQSSGSDTASQSIYRFVLDYDVPESPAFAVLGVTPAQVLRGSAAKPIAANLLTSARDRGRVGGGIALDFSPVVLLPASSRVVRSTTERRGVAGHVPDNLASALSRMTISVGTIQAEHDSASTRGAIGFRWNIRDDRDPLQRPELRDFIARGVADALVAAGRVSSPDDDDDGRGTTTTLAGKPLSRVYEEARDSARKLAGYSVTIGYAAAALVRSSVLHRDSLVNPERRAWIAIQFYPSAAGWDVLAMADYRDPPGERGRIRFGSALRALTDPVILAGEIFFDGRLTPQPGVTAEVRVVPQFSLVLGVSSERPGDAALPGGAGDSPVLRFTSHVRWNLSESR